MCNGEGSKRCSTLQKATCGGPDFSCPFKCGEEKTVSQFLSGERFALWPDKPRHRLRSPIAVAFEAASPALVTHFTLPVQSFLFLS